MLSQSAEEPNCFFLNGHKSWIPVVFCRTKNRLYLISFLGMIKPRKLTGKGSRGKLACRFLGFQILICWPAHRLRVATTNMKV